MTRREYYIRCSACCIDWPSVYMGGPGKNSLRMAERIVNMLEGDGFDFSGDVDIMGNPVVEGPK